jgi:hypothetical protein
MDTFDEEIDPEEEERPARPAKSGKWSGRRKIEEMLERRRLDEELRAYELDAQWDALERPDHRSRGSTGRHLQG